MKKYRDAYRYDMSVMVPGVIESRRQTIQVAANSMKEAIDLGKRICQDRGYVYERMTFVGPATTPDIRPPLGVA